MKEINNIRILAAEIVEKAKSGHPGAPMGMAAFVYTLYKDYLNIDPENPDWINRDIFILSNGHACVIQYIMNYLIGYLTMEDLQNFRQVGSMTPGHPERRIPGIECTTGPLGQGLANAVGFAISLKKLNMPSLTNRVYCVFGDGCYQEGIGQESFSIIASLKLNNLTLIYDFNKVTIDGSTELSMNENVVQRFQSLGFDVDTVDGENIDEIKKVLEKKSDNTRIIILNTIIGYGSNAENTSAVHGAPLGEEDIANIKERFNMQKEKFYVSPSLKNSFLQAKERMRKYKNDWEKKNRNQKVLEKWEKRKKNLFNETQGNIFKNKYSEEAKSKATRKHFSDCLNNLVKNDFLLGGAADLEGSVLTKIKSFNDFTGENTENNFINFGIREHVMFGIMNGIACHGYFLPYCGTFLNFSSYGFPSIRLASMDQLNTFYVLTHDSIFLGEDGPTHQPIETLVTLRATPNLVTFRPCDGRECRAALEYAIKNGGPKAVILSRQNLPDIAQSSESEALKGAYYVFKVENPNIILLSTGSEVHLCLEVAKSIKTLKIAVVSFFSWELFEKQENKYKSEILKNTLRISVEALSTFGWERYSHYQIGMVGFGGSGPAKDLGEYFGFTVSNISESVLNYYEEYKKAENV